ncbi:hypothetical protein SteCoe_10105 [Stentor coeruleus]|uniref:FCP1 homology domain-containing protein n=1 Tax=Stentor coeruleus TaxID=5963 RepID=A0A1R2CGE2_9CILI|nr:hypothetical protein SteCoe_10105 [Stentor coeruleus]
MKKTRSQKSQLALQSKILSKSSKLTIEVPDEDDEIILSKFNKNSPTSHKMSLDYQKASGSIFAPKHRTSTSTNKAKKLYGMSVVPKLSQKKFKFPSTPKTNKKMTPSKSPHIKTSRAKSKVHTPTTKFSTTPTYRALIEVNKKRPKTTTNSDKSLKAETGSCPNLNILVTQVKLNTPRTDDVLSEEEIQVKSDMLYKEHLFQTFQAMKFIRTLQPVNLEQLKEKRLNVPRRKGFENKKTIIFDLDETLVHCCEDITTCNPMVILPVIFPTGETVQAGINIRPYALECLREVNKEFEIFVFTASHPCYANVVLDYIDPNKELIHQRFFRDSCVNMGGVFIKDLRIFANRNLKDLIIVDNAAYSFAYQLDNGIPIVSWHDDQYDKELYNLMDYVKALAAVEDVRDVNEQTFHLRTFYEDYINEFLAADTVSSPKLGKKF